MSQSLALKSSPVADERTGAPRLGFRAKFAALMEALVTSQARRFENVDPLMFRYPPF